MYGISTCTRIRASSILVPLSDADKSVTKNGVTIDVISIDESNVGTLYRFSCQNSRLTKSNYEKAPTLKSNFNVSNVLARFFLPRAISFAIKNISIPGHIIKLNGSDVGITVAGKDWRKLDVQKINFAWLKLMQTDYPYQKTVPAELISAIQNVPIWDDNQKILPGKSITLYAPFDVQMKKGFSTATLSIYDIVTNVDLAGNPTERTSMDFNFKEGVISIKQN